MLLYGFLALVALVVLTSFNGPYDDRKSVPLSQIISDDEGRKSQPN